MTVAPSMSAHPTSRYRRLAPETLSIDGSPALTRMLAAFLALHGVAHIAGTSDSFTTAAGGRSVQYLAGAWTVSDPSLLRVLGVAWAVVGAAFVFVAVAVWLRRPRWPRALAGVTAASLVVVTVALWASAVGVAIDVALLVVAWRAGAFRGDGGRR